MAGQQPGAAMSNDIVVNNFRLIYSHEHKAWVGLSSPTGRMIGFGPDARREFKAPLFYTEHFARRYAAECAAAMGGK
jgi:hypothetical protein